MQSVRHHKVRFASGFLVGKKRAIIFSKDTHHDFEKLVD